ncbi:MAG: hypothetical protein LBU43_02415 [Candidatus Accumulibacter sp.]|jgi:hypothetical protein|nr:hypothetical protein [Accumulibacter sp.]
MSEPVAIAKVPTSNSPKVAPGQTFIKGKIVGRTKIGKSFIHVVTSPSPDEYSYPRVYEISSLAPLGEVDEFVGLVCDITGRRTQKSWTNPESGETRRFTGAYVGLRAVEE